MGEVAIRVEGLGKSYRIGRRPRRDTVCATVTHALTAPWRRAGGLLRGQTTGASDYYDTIWALKDVSFEVARGEVVGIIGRNGGGKSTLLKILSRITELTEGWAEIHGRVGALLEVGTGFHRELTGRENIYLNGAILGMTKNEVTRKFDEIVAFAEIDSFLDTPVKHYSSGMRMRLAFSVAAHFEPEILVVDEVLAVGDANFQRKCLGKMQDVADAGRTVLFVSHDLSAVTRLCQRAILLEQGRVAADGAAIDVVPAYLQGVIEGIGARSWTFETAPGTAEVKLVSVTLMRDDGVPAAAVSVEDRLYLRIGYTVQQMPRRFRCAVLFFIRGVCAFTSVEPEECERYPDGVCYSTVTVPPNLLTEGEYSIDVEIFASRAKRLQYVAARDVLLFHVTDRMSGNSARGDYAERLSGVVRPHLHWQIDSNGK